MTFPGVAVPLPVTGTSPSVGILVPLGPSVTGLFEPSPLIDLGGPKSSVSVTGHVSFGLIFFWYGAFLGWFLDFGFCGVVLCVWFLFVCLIDFFCNQNNVFFPL